MSYTQTILRQHEPSQASVVASTSSLERSDERKLGVWTRFHAFCSLRCCDLAGGLSKTYIPGDSQPLYYFLNYPCRRAEIVGLVVSAWASANCISYSIDDGTGIIECTLFAERTDIASSPSAKGKRKAESGSDAKPGWSFDTMFPVGSVLRVLGQIQESFNCDERYLRIEEASRVTRLSEEAKHAKRAKELRRTTYKQRLDLTLALHRLQMDQSQVDLSAEAINARCLHAGPSRLASSPTKTSSQRSAAPSSDISFFLENEGMATPRPIKRAFPGSQHSAIDVDALDQESYVNTTSEKLRPQARLHAPHRLSDDQLHIDTFTSYLYDYFCRHAGETISYRQLYSSKNFAPLARRLVRKLIAAGTKDLESDTARALVSELTRLAQKSEQKAIDCLYLRTLTQLCSSMYIAPSPSTEDAYQFVTVGTLGPTLDALLRNRPRTPHELAMVLRRGEERWRWARTERVQDILREMALEGTIKAVRDGRFAILAD